MLGSGADAIVLIDLNEADAKRAAKELTDWFGTCHVASGVSTR